MRLREAADAWHTARLGEWSDSYRQRVGQARATWAHFFGDPELCEITPSAVAEFYQSRMRRAASTLNLERSILSSFMKYAAQMKWVPEWRTECPIEAWPKLRAEVDEEKLQVLAPEDETAFFKELAGEDEASGRFMRAALYSGLRGITLRRLEWRWVLDGPEGSFVKIPGRAMKGGRRFEAPLHPEARTAMGPRGPGLVFPEVPPRALMLARVKKVGRRLGLSRNLTIHSMRKTFATRLLNSGTPLTTVMRLGDWKTASILTNRYMGRLNVEAGRAALQGLTQSRLSG